MGELVRKIILYIPNDILEDISEEIEFHSNESCELGLLPSSGFWKKFQGIWQKAMEKK